VNRAFCAARLPPAACGLWQGGAVGGLGEEAQCLLTLPPPPPPQNFCSRAALEALGSCLNNKYSEGYPGKR
jgi:hypothetical protein